MTQPVHDPLNSRAAITCFVVLGTIGVLSFIVQPAIVQGFVTLLGMSESQAVDLVGIEMAGVAIATVVLAVLGERFHWRPLVALAVLLAVVGNAWSAFALHGGALSTARFVAGLGHGGLISLSFTFVGLTRRVERNLALYLVALLSYGAIGIWVAPFLFAHVGLFPIFMAFALLTALSLATLPWVPGSSSAQVHPSPHARQLGRVQQGIALLSVLAYNLAQGIAWAILFLVGTGAGLAEQTVANALFLSQVAAVGGALAALYLSERWGRTPAIVTGIVGGAACIALMLGPLPLSLYVIAVCGFNLLWNFVVPFVLGAVGDMDEKGRLMSPAIAMQMIGLGLGPIVTARLIGDGDYRLAEYVCIAGFVASLLLVLPPLLRHARLSAPPAGDASR